LYPKQGKILVKMTYKLLTISISIRRKVLLLLQASTRTNHIPSYLVLTALSCMRQDISFFAAD